MQLPKEKMFDKTGQWIHLETFEDFDKGLSDLIDLWSNHPKASTQAVKESSLVNFKADLDAAALTWMNNRAKSKKYASIAKELAEFEDAIKEGANVVPESNSNTPTALAEIKKKI